MVQLMATQHTPAVPRSTWRRAVTRSATLALGFTLLAVGCGGSSSDDAAEGDSAGITGEGSIGDETISGGQDTGGEQVTGSDGEAALNNNDNDASSTGGNNNGGGGDEFGIGGEDDEEFTPDAAEEPEELPDVAMPVLDEPEDVLPELRAEVGDALQDAVDSPDVDILDVAKLPDLAPTDEEVASFDDGHQRTSSGRLIVLDELASLACANIEIALGEIDEGQLPSAKEHISTAGERAGRSEVDAVEKWSDALGDAASGDSIDATTLVGFLSVCIEGGYVI